ncbi:hypothetical protein EYC84_011006 [Monilinia fructicola]|uniref:Uncharacterized protein n=1 Tax=Monilinia fructicola TaxID=38448 RepID=A0A5M9JAB2_MONFR|nr:hypothetical protein EYC84_011006 [Monilinia fructicola]
MNINGALPLLSQDDVFTAVYAVLITKIQRHRKFKSPSPQSPQWHVRMNDCASLLDHHSNHHQGPCSGSPYET